MEETLIAELPEIGIGLSDWAPRYDLVLCDVWGVLHNGVRYFEGTVDVLRRFRALGKTVILLSNAPVPHDRVRLRLDGVGVPRDVYDAIVTSGDVTVDLIVEAGCPSHFNIGPPAEDALYREAARVGPRAPRSVSIEAAELAVCVGLDETGEEPQDYDGALEQMRARDLILVCANPDIVVEVGDDLVYCAGAIAERYEAIGGRVVHAGKPHAAIYAKATRLAKTVRGDTPRTRILAIGDAMMTDVAGARRQGIASIFVTTGVHRAAIHRDGDVATVDARMLADFLDGFELWPTAALPALVWDA